MALTREEAARILDPATSREALLPYAYDGPRRLAVVEEACRIGAAALRPVSRERVNQVWRGCEWCNEEWGTCNPITNRFTMPPRGGIRFCPMCGKPLADEAGDILLRRLEAMKDAGD